MDTRHRISGTLVLSRYRSGGIEEASKHGLWPVWNQSGATTLNKERCLRFGTDVSTVSNNSAEHFQPLLPLLFLRAFTTGATSELTDELLQRFALGRSAFTGSAAESGHKHRREVATSSPSSSARCTACGLLSAATAHAIQEIRQSSHVCSPKNEGGCVPPSLNRKSRGS